MINIKKIFIKCPKCNIATKIEIKKVYCKFVIFKCSSCKNNIAYYDHKVTNISDKLIGRLKKKNKLKICGNALISVKNPLQKHDTIITKDDLLNFKILLETEKDFDSFISKL